MDMVSQVHHTCRVSETYLPIPLRARLAGITVLLGMRVEVKPEQC